MGCWGFGLFESDRDLDTVGKLGDEAGLGKLEEEVKTNASLKRSNENEQHPQEVDIDDIYYSLYARLCSDVEKVRSHLHTPDDSGNLPLDKLVDKYSKNGNAYERVILGACLMSLGCTIPDKFLDLLRETYAEGLEFEESITQMAKALDGKHAFQNGVQYDFDSPGLIEIISVSADSGSP